MSGPDLPMWQVAETAVALPADWSIEPLTEPDIAPEGTDRDCDGDDG